MSRSHLHAVDGGTDAPTTEGDGASVASTVQARRIAARILRRALDSRDVSLTEAAEVAGLTKQRLHVLLDDEHHAPLDVVVALALRGGARGRDVAAGVADQLHAMVDGGRVAPHANAADGIATLAKELGEYAAAAVAHGTDRSTLRKELVDLIDAAKRELVRIDQGEG